MKKDFFKSTVELAQLMSKAAMDSMEESTLGGALGGFSLGGITGTGTGYIQRAMLAPKIHNNQMDFMKAKTTLDGLYSNIVAAQRNVRNPGAINFATQQFMKRAPQLMHDTQRLQRMGNRMNMMSKRAPGKLGFAGAALGLGLGAIGGAVNGVNQ